MPLTIDEDAFSVHRIATSLLVYVVDLSACLVGVDVRSDEDAFPVNKLSKTLFWNMLLMYQLPLLLLMLDQMMTLYLIITD